MSVKTVLAIIATVLLFVSAILMILLIMMQEGSQKGLGSLGGTSTSNNYWKQNQKNSTKNKLIRWTRTFGIIFFGSALALATILA